MDQPSGATPSPALVHALHQALRPLVRLMLAKGVTLQYLLELLKSLYVEVADRDFRIDGKIPTDSRISLISGVHRKDVSRLRTELQEKEPVTPSVVSLGAQLVATWLGNPAYLDADGKPLPLPKHKREGGDLSFEGLVGSVNSDIRSKAVLDEWLRLGIARIDERKQVRLIAEAFIPSKGFDEKAFYFGHNLHDHAAAAAYNLLGGQPPFLERSVHYDALSQESIRILSRQSLDLGMKALLAVNKSAMAAEKSDVANTSPRQRMTFGIYFYSAPSTEEQAEQQ